jgi:hypothetical protein
MNDAREAIPQRYSDHSKTELRATVRKQNPPFDFDLKGPIPGLPVPPEPTPAEDDTTKGEPTPPADASKTDPHG